MSTAPLAANALRDHVLALAQMPARSVSEPAALERAAVYVEGQLRGAGYSPVSQEYADGKARFRNVIATLNPDERPIIVIGAHYDVCGPQPGADDNASGVAVLIETARRLNAVAARVPYQIRFVAYSTEEPPYFTSDQMGSYVHATSLVKERAVIELMIGLEMVGYFSDQPHSQTYPEGIPTGQFPDTGDFIAVVSKPGHEPFLADLERAFTGAGLKAISLSAPEPLPGLAFSDHMNYWKRGLPAVMVTDTAFFRNPNYHRDTDTRETLDYRRMALVVEGLSSYFSR
jgi:Zn-dependent M28 family amino/carboxypeptidase